MKMTPEEHALLFLAAADLYAAVKVQHDALDTLLALCAEKIPGFIPSNSGAWPAFIQGNVAIAKAEGRSATRGLASDLAAAVRRNREREREQG